MTDIRRTLLWMVFAVSLMMLWDAWNKHNGHPTVFGMPAPTVADVASGAASGAASLPTAASAGSAASSQPASAVATAAAASAPAVSENVDVKTDVLNATLDTQDAKVTRVELSQHFATVQQGWADPILQALGFEEKKKIDPKPIVLLEPERKYSAQSGLIDASGKPVRFGVLKAVPGDRTLKDGQNELAVRFESEVVNGWKLIKTFTFKRGDYVIGVKHEVQNVGTADQASRLYLQLVRDGHEAPGGLAFNNTYTGPAVYNSHTKFKKLGFSDLDKGEPLIDKADEKADNGWVAMVQHYFASAWLQNDKVDREFFAHKADGDYAVGMIFNLGNVAAGQSKTFDAKLYAGPQDETKLEVLATGLELVKDYGWTTILAKPLFWLLGHLHNLLGNWGWAIVGLVVLLKAAFYWLNANAYRSMAKMKAVNPKIQEMRERLKADPQKMQQEMMRIYREEKVNPIGGCLPILIQIPVFIALYSVLSSSVEMRGAPWIGWIVDLSAKDPFYVLPVLMTLSSLLQTWLNPTPPDPMQAKMMWIMPLAFSVMFFQFPAGLVLYWLTNNVLSIAQQWMINKQLGVTN
jgi:YidC/Oxa1 family membrane protein insertase